MLIMMLQEKDEHVPNKQDDYLWVKIPDNDIEVSQRQDLNDYELMQVEYLRNMQMIDNTEKTLPTRIVR